MSFFIPFSSRRRAAVAWKIKRLLDSAVSDLKTINNIYASSCSEARTDVARLLKSAQTDLTQKDRALLWNYLNVLFMIRGYCDMLNQRMELLISNRRIPEEMKEVVANLQYAAPRCAELPRLQEIARALIKLVGKESAAPIIELRPSCGVTPTMIQLLSLRQPSLENRLKMIKEIGKGIGLGIVILDNLGSACAFEICS